MLSNSSSNSNSISISIAVYFTDREKPDPAIHKGLMGAGCEISVVRNIADAIHALDTAGKAECGKAENNGSGEGDRAPASRSLAVLVAEVQAGAIPLLTLLSERRVPLPPVVLLDRSGDDIHTVIDALKHEVADYLLDSDTEFQREIRVRILAERAMLEKRKPHGNGADDPAAAKTGSPNLVIMPDFHWDPNVQVIYVGGSYLRLSPVEGRVFDMLVSKHHCTVSLHELVARALNQDAADVQHGVRLLRPHMMRLRNKLEQHPELAHRIVNMRGSGYMFI